MIKFLTGFTIYGYLVYGYLTSGLAAAENWQNITEVVDEINSVNCQEGLSLNFSGAYISYIRGTFINSPSVKCINMANNFIQSIDDGALESLTNLMYLNISRNKLQNQNLLSFGGYETLRILSLDYAATYYRVDLNVSELHPELRYLSLIGNDLRDIFYYNTTSPYPSKLPILTAFPKIMYMDLSKNGIGGINLYSRGTLKYLFLQENKLSAVDTATLSNLLILNVDSNGISRMTYDYSPSAISLRGLRKLSGLSIANNQINFISSTAFRDTPLLLFLNLSNNQLENIQPMAFSPLLALRHLILDNNKLKNIPNVTYEIELAIEDLSLYNNRITSIPDRIFIKLPGLEKLNLAANMIEHVDAGAFEGLQRLEYLNLAKNKLTSLPENWCSSLINLRFLDLSNNLFTSFQSLSLMNVIPLHQLNLYNHKLKYIHASFVHNLPENMTINLS